MVIEHEVWEKYRKRALEQELEATLKDWFKSPLDEPYKMSLPEAERFGFSVPQDKIGLESGPEIRYEDYQQWLKGQGLQYHWPAPEVKPLELPETMTAAGWEATKEGLLKSPAGELFTAEDFEQKRQEEILSFQKEILPTLPEATQSLWGTEQFWPAYEEQLWESARSEGFAETFPEMAGGDVNQLLREMEVREGATFEEIDEAMAAQDAFIELLQQKGRTPEVEALVGALFEQPDVLLETVFPAIPPEFQREGWVKDNIIDPLYVGAVNFVHGIKQTVTSVVPTLFTKESGITRGEYLGPKEFYDWQEKLKNDIVRDSQERFIRYTEEHDKWVAGHPELTPKPEYEDNPFDNPKLLLDPGYYSYMFTSSLAYSLSTMGTIALTTLATGGNIVAGIGAGMAVAGAPETSDMTNELLNQGIPYRDAVEWGTLYGAVAGGIESVTDLPLIGIAFKPVKQFMQPFWKTLLKGTANRIVKSTITVAVIPSVEGMEEAVTQATRNAILKNYDSSKSILEGVGEAFIKGAITSLPFAAWGGVASYRSFSKALPAKTQTQLHDLVDKFETTGATEEQAQVMAANEIAKTPEGEQEIEKAIEVAKEEATRIPPAVPKITFPEAGIYKEGDTFTTPEGDARLGIWSESQQKWVVTLPDGTQQRLTVSEMDKLVDTKAWVYKPAEVVAPEGVELEAPYTAKQMSEMEGELGGLKEWLTTEPAAKLMNLIKKVGWYKGEVKNLTLKQFRDLTGREPVANTLTEDKKHVKWEYALDTIATEIGYESGDALKEAIERAGEANARIKELQTGIVRIETEKPLETVPEPKPEEVAVSPTGEQMLTSAQVEKTLTLFGLYVESPSAVSAWELTRELRRETRRGRAENLKNRTQQLIVEHGLLAEEAMNQAIRETMSGELPQARTDYLDDLTSQMRDALFNKVYMELKDKPFEMMSTATALTNALLGKPIPREPGVKGLSAYKRLQRVFTPEIFKAIEKGAKEGKTLQGIIEGLYEITGQEPIPVDKATSDYLRNLTTAPMGQAWLMGDTPTILKLTETKSKEQIESETTELKIELAAKPTPVTRFEVPIEEGAKQIPLLPRPAKDNIIRILKEIGMLPVDIGNFLRANKASFDFSFWRQQAPLIAGHPITFIKANIEAWKALWSQKSAEASWQRITRDPLYQIYEESERRGGDFLRPLELKKGTAQWRGVEEYGYLTGERLLPRLTAKIPWVKLSARAFETGANVHNWLIFKNYYQAMLKLNEMYASGQKTLGVGEAFSIEKEMVDFSKSLSNFTGRGSLGKFAATAPELSGLFFAPRLAIGRILSVKDLVNSNPRVRLEAWKNAASFVGVFGGIVLLGAAMGWWSVERDPRNAEYMSIRIGNTRIDPWGGYRQFLVFFTRAITGTGVSSVTGAEYEADPINLIQTFLRGKASPLASLILDFWRGKNFIGEKVDVANKEQWVERVAPFALWDIYEAYKDDPIHMLQALIPAVVGAGVQTYTGDWDENFKKLGMPKYSDNFSYGLTNPKYLTDDFWADHSVDFKGVDPATLTEAKGFPPYIRAMVESRLIKEHIDTLPNQKLVSINADLEKGTTFADYYSMWVDRGKLVAAGDKAEWTINELQPDGTYKEVVYTGEDALKAFDKDERTRNANLGNFSQRQFSLLNEYWSITDKKLQAEFLEKHETEIGVNLKDDYLRKHPRENAQLAIWGQAKILSLKAYNEFKKLLVQYDIPDSAVPEQTLPPEGSVENYFKYQELVDNTSANSWEVKQLMAQDDDLREWLEREPVDTPLPALELKVKHRELFDLEESYKDKDSPNYLDDTVKDAEGLTARDRAIRDLKADNPGWVDDMRRIEAIEHDASDTIIESWVERGKLVDEYGGGSSKAMVWLLDHKEAWDWALEQELLTDDGKDWNEPVLRINAKWLKEDDWYDNGIPAKYEHVDNKNARDAAVAKERAEYLADNTEYQKDVYRRKAYGLVGLAPDYQKFPTELIDTYVEYYTSQKIMKPDNWEKTSLTDLWYEDDWWLKEHMELYDTMVELGIWSKDYKDFSKVPTREVFDIYTQEYLPLAPNSKARKDVRAKYPELDAWGVDKFGWKPIGDKGTPDRELEWWEELQRKKKWQIYLETLK